MIRRDAGVGDFAVPARAVDSIAKDKQTQLLLVLVVLALILFMSRGKND